MAGLVALVLLLLQRLLHPSIAAAVAFAGMAAVASSVDVRVLVLLQQSYTVLSLMTSVTLS